MKTYITTLCAFVLGIGALLGAYTAALAADSVSVSAIASSTASSTISTVHSHPMIPVCLTISTDLSYGATDTSSENQVTLLQGFLLSNGYFDSSNMGTGQFGPLTRAAVLRFQADHAVPATGFVGPLTRAAIVASQGGTGCGAPATTASPTPATLYSVNPSDAGIGDTITIVGSGFASSSTVLLDGMAVARDIPIAASVTVTCANNSSCVPGIHQTLTFTLPSSAAPSCSPKLVCPMYIRLLTTGDYKLSVTSGDSATTSNELPFSITHGAQSLVNVQN